MDITQKETGIEQRSDNTYVRKPVIAEKMPFNWGNFYKNVDGDLISSTQGRVYKDKYGKIHTAEQYEDYMKNGLKLIESVNNRSKANFVQRLNNSERQHIQDWETPNKIATHKMSWATEGEKAIVFPMVQEINGSLHDFSNPKYNHKKWDALDNAINKGDTLIMTPNQAKWFTENYKNFYPKFGDGGKASFKSQLYAATNRSPDGRPLEQGLKNVYPEMALAGFVRAGLTGVLPSFKNTAASTISGITSRQIKDKLTKGLEQATNTGETINDAVRNYAKAIVTKTSKEVVKRLPEPLKRPAMKTINRGWDMATSYYGINGQIATINDIVNK